eukprot:TRINITY_DN4636_c0_g1_i3.p1 TRINITY_DN4636_c0_g1~~TRINITY_DN4636_c0_g1_i3.p1  ORF type:complete len:426 (+),score=59.38 TRINITY_DN4636_c0_g1_i3:569-1846(+)
MDVARHLAHIMDPDNQAKCVSQSLLQYAQLPLEEKKFFGWPDPLQHILDMFGDISDAIASAQENSPSKLDKYHIHSRVGAVVSGDSWRRHDGSNAAVFHGTMRGAFEEVSLAIRMVFNYNRQAVSTRSLMDHLSRECGLLDRNGVLGLDGCAHPNVLLILDHFADTLPPQLPDFDVDRTLLATRTYFSISPLCQMSLKQLLDFRIARMSGRQNMDGKAEADDRSESGVLSEQVVVHLALGMAAGLHHLHQHFLVHRDVKPDNILLYWGSNDIKPDILQQISQGEFGVLSDSLLLQCVPIVADLGESINRSVRRSFVMDYLDGFSLGGAPAYLPPEIRQARPEEDQLDYSKSDVYGLGCVMYEMMSAQAELPLGSDSGLRACDLPQYYSRALRDLVSKATAVLPQRCSILDALEQLVRLHECDCLS